MTQNKRMPMHICSIIIAVFLPCTYGAKTDKSLRILMVGHELSATGAPLVLHNKALQLREQGHEVSFLFAQSKGRDKMENLVRAAKFKYHIATKEFLQPIEIDQYDVILVNTIVIKDWILIQFMTYGFAFSKRCFWWVHEIPYGDRRDAYTPNLTYVRRLIIQVAEAVFVSQASLNAFQEWVLQEGNALGLQLLSSNATQPIGSFTNVPPGLQSWVPRSDGSKCDRSSAGWPFLATRQEYRAQLKADDSDSVTLFVGSFAAHKGVIELVKSWTKFAVQAAKQGSANGTLHLVFVGKGPIKPDEIKRAFKTATKGTKKTKLHVVGALRKAPDKIGYYAAADTFVMNSECEPFAQVTMEAMSFSLPVLGSSCGGTKNIVVENVTGLFHEFEANLASPTLIENLEALDTRFEDRAALAMQYGTAGCKRIHELYGDATAKSAFNDALLSVLDAQSKLDASFADLEERTRIYAASVRGSHLEYQPEVVYRPLPWEYSEKLPSVVVGSNLPRWFENDEMHVFGQDVEDKDNEMRQKWSAFDLTSREWMAHEDQESENLIVHHVAQGADPTWALHFVQRKTMRLWQMRVVSTVTSKLKAEHILPQRNIAAVALYGGKVHLFGTSGATSLVHWSIPIAKDGGIKGDWQTSDFVFNVGAFEANVMVLKPKSSKTSALYLWGFVHSIQDDQVQRQWPLMAMFKYTTKDGWQRIKDVPLPLTHNQNCMLRAGRDAVIIMGGQHYEKWLSNSVWMFNATSEVWTNLGTLPFYIKGATCGVSKGQLVMIGGELGYKEAVNPTPAKRMSEYVFIIDVHESLAELLSTDVM